MKSNKVNRENLKFVMDVEPSSIWLRTTPGELAQRQPFYCTEAGHFIAHGKFVTARSNKESWILFVTMRGSGFISQGENEVILREGDALLMDCRIPQLYGTASGADVWDHYWIHINGTGVSTMYDILTGSSSGLSGIGTVSSGSNVRRLVSVPMTSINLAGSIESIFNGIRNESTESTIENGLMIHRILTRMVQMNINQSSGTNQEGRNRIQAAADYLRNHYADSVSVDDLIRLTNFSKSYLMREFRQYMGTTPHNYLLNCRITEAKELLSLTSLSVGEIAERVGFRDESNFSQRFLSLTGQSPLQYRKSSIRQI